MEVNLVDGGGTHIGDVRVLAGRPSAGGFPGVQLHQASSVHVHESARILFNDGILVLKDARAGTIDLPGWTVVMTGKTTFSGKIHCGRPILCNAFELHDVQTVQA